jgi:hypothetical protein
MLHIIKTQEDCDKATMALFKNDDVSHIIYIYAHGSDSEDLYNVLETNDNSSSIYIDLLSDAIRDAMIRGTNVYLIANSCYWNLKYDRGITTPTISFGPDEATRIPYRSETIENRLAKLPDKIEKSVFLELVKILQKDYQKHATAWEVYDENGNIRNVKKFRIIQSETPPPMLMLTPI